MLRKRDQPHRPRQTLDGELSAEAQARFNQWARTVAKRGVNLDEITTELLVALLTRERLKENVVFVLGAERTSSGKPERFEVRYREMLGVFGPSGD